jgi:mono/diheme cytochrome c family protein
LGIWLRRDAAEKGRLGDALAPYAAEPLPPPGAPVDSTLADLGARTFKRRCAACHAITGESRVGPDLAGVTRRRDLAWIRRMMLAPDSMTTNDPVAQMLKARYQVQMMVPGGVSPAESRGLVEFLRRVDAGGDG